MSFGFGTITELFGTIRHLPLGYPECGYVCGYKNCNEFALALVNLECSYAACIPLMKVEKYADKKKWFGDNWDWIFLQIIKIKINFIMKNLVPRNEFDKISKKLEASDYGDGFQIHDAFATIHANGSGYNSAIWHTWNGISMVGKQELREPDPETKLNEIMSAIKLKIDEGKIDIGGAGEQYSREDIKNIGYYFKGTNGVIQIFNEFNGQGITNVAARDYADIAVGGDDALGRIFLLPRESKHWYYEKSAQLELNGKGRIIAGGYGNSGRIQLKSDDFESGIGMPRYIEMNSSSEEIGQKIEFREPFTTVEIFGRKKLQYPDIDGDEEAVGMIFGAKDRSGITGFIKLYGFDGKKAFKVDGLRGGKLELYDRDGQKGILATGDGTLEVKHRISIPENVSISSEKGGGTIELNNNKDCGFIAEGRGCLNVSGIYIDGSYNDGAKSISLIDKAMIEVTKEGNGIIALCGEDLDISIELNGKDGIINLGGGQIKFEGHKGCISCKGNVECGDVSLVGEDCSEEFEVIDEENICPGTVLVISEDGKLCQSQREYDKRVAGIVSGAMDFRPGIILGRKTFKKGRMPIALAGKTYCKIDASKDLINVGDLLTTSSIPGHAMKASNPKKSFGAVIGKALAAFKDGKGMIPILVALQ